ncbi:hypothetical protein BRC90_06230 [Halobacteriales archaeon QS_4_69_34]|nr:MAG: hypothetical protein BRC90_06230 [Halobacteriales archaeon QS_4_69_34]
MLFALGRTPLYRWLGAVETRAVRSAENRVRTPIDRGRLGGATETGLLASAPETDERPAHPRHGV